MKFWTSIDPGCVGWARWADRGLFACGVAKDVNDVYIEGDLWIEKPQIYRASKSKGDPNDLIKVAIQVGRFVERCENRDTGGRVHFVLPAEWKGQVSKEIIIPRILSTLSEHERYLIEQACAQIARGKVHNMIEAIGIGLHACGRMGRGGT